MTAMAATKRKPANSAKAVKTVKTGKPRSLREYHRKRDFASTPEPKGDAARDARRAGKVKQLYFCVQKHLASHLHYDFRLEHRGVLLSWAVPKGPSLNPKDKRLAMRVEDHPWDYRDFEGVIPEGYGAGIVMLWDQGMWRPAPGFDDVAAALEKGELKFFLNGVKLKGGWVLVRTGGGRWGKPAVDEAGVSRSWLLIKHRDEWAGEVDITTFAPKSVKSGGDFEDILADEKADVWQSHRPAEGGAAGKMLQRIIEKAAAIKARGTKEKKSKPKRRAARATRARVA
jgi:bifunctional non-homologous end joining protein LigD